MRIICKHTEKKIFKTKPSRTYKWSNVSVEIIKGLCPRRPHKHEFMQWLWVSKARYTLFQIRFPVFLFSTVSWSLALPLGRESDSFCCDILPEGQWGEWGHRPARVSKPVWPEPALHSHCQRHERRQLDNLSLKAPPSDQHKQKPVKRFEVLTELAMCCKPWHTTHIPRTANDCASLNLISHSRRKL